VIARKMKKKKKKKKEEKESKISQIFMRMVLAVSAQNYL
jgi:hypothetical protein